MTDKPVTQGVFMEAAEPKAAFGIEPINTKASAYAKASNGTPVSWAQLESFAEGGFMIQPFISGTLLGFSDGSVILRDNKTKSEYVMSNMQETQTYIERGVLAKDQFCMDLAVHIDMQNKMMHEAIKQMQG